MALFSRRPKASAPVPVVVQSRSEGGGGAAHGPRESRVFELGSDMLRRARAHKTGLLSAKFYSDALMEWSMKDHEFKVQMFRFVDAFPMLKTPEAVFDHLQDYLGQPGVTAPPVIAAAMKAGGLAKGIAARTISGQITGMAAKFIAGSDAASATPGLKAMWDDGIAFSVDLLGETCVSDEEADAYARKYLDLIANLPAEVAAWKAQPRLEVDHLGAIPRVNVSVKISALSARVDPIDTEGSIADLMRRLVPILEAARDRGVFVNFDMEHHAFKDLTIELFMRCVEKVDFQTGLAMQAYLRSGPEDARRVCEWAKRTGKQVTVRLVKGAYWDAETIRSEMHGWPCPVWPQKWQTDACFERMTEALLDACPRTKGEPGVKLALGSHNVRSIAAALAGLESRGLPREAIGIMYGANDMAQGFAFQPNGAFYVRGSFDLPMPTGTYFVTISTGYEFVQQTEELTFRSGDHLKRTYDLKRWIDMPKRGWYSADDHVHLRRSPRENPLIVEWMAAEDVHVGTLLQMGDFWTTYFSQYAFGEKGRYRDGNYTLTSGQEEPRTRELGHTISLGAEAFVRFPALPYQYLMAQCFRLRGGVDLSRTISSETIAAIMRGTGLRWMWRNRCGESFFLCPFRIVQFN